MCTRMGCVSILGHDQDVDLSTCWQVEACRWQGGWHEAAREICPMLTDDDQDAW